MSVNVAVPVPIGLMAWTVYVDVACASCGVPVTAPVELLKTNPSGSVPSKLYEATGPPVLPVTEMLTAVALSAVTEDAERVICGTALYEVNDPDETPVPAALVTAIVPAALPIAVIAVMDVALFIVNESTGDPPIVTRVAPVKLVPVMVIEVPATPVVGVNEVIVGWLATTAGVKLKTPPGATSSIEPPFVAPKVSVMRPLDEAVSTVARIVVLFETLLIGIFVKLRPMRIDCKVNPALIKPVPTIVITVPGDPEVVLKLITVSVSVGTGVEVSRTGPPEEIVMDPPPSGTVTVIRTVKVSNLTEMTGETDA